MTVAVVVQARMGSTRFPGKVLAPLHGRPMLDHVLERALRSRCADVVVLATSTAKTDDALVGIAAARGVTVVRGPEDDVLERFRLALDEVRPGVVVRITADCPLLDPRLVDRVVRVLLDSGVDYASNIEPPSYPDGYDVEAITVGALSRVAAEARMPYHREHVTALAREKPELYSHTHVACRRDYSTIRLTVDIPADLARVEAILDATGDRLPGLGAVLAVLRERPDLRDQTGLPARDERYHAQRLAATTGEDV
jgi:spore coat polysaccharide biosynthesis protein SpsF (cytidylyltransferase family)